MPLLELSVITSKLAGMATEGAFKALSNSEAAIRARDRLHLPARPDKDNFGSLYRHTLVEWGVCKPQPVLDFFRDNRVIDAIDRYAKDGDADALAGDMAELANWAAEARLFEGLEIDPRSQLAGFLLTFNKTLDDARPPGGARRDRLTAGQFDALQKSINDLGAALARQPAPPAMPSGGPIPAAPEVMAELAAIRNLLTQPPAVGDIHLSGNFPGAILNLLSPLTHVSQTTGVLATPLAPLDENGRPPLPAPAHTTPPGSHLNNLERNPLFTGREDDLRQLGRDLLYEPAGAPAVVTSGIGGVGKTQLAVEFAYRYGRFFHGVYWVSLADAAPDAVRRELAACGEAMGLWPVGDAEIAPEQKAALTLAAWRQPTPRLIIFDNCETPALLDAWRPKGGGARALVTSRNAGWPAGFAVQPLETLPRDRSRALLRRYLAGSDRKATDAELDVIAEAVGDLPLALTLAGSYLATYPTIPIDGYLRDLAAIDPLPIIAPWPGTAHSWTRHEQDVARTFAVSFDKLRPAEDETDAAALVQLAGATCLVRGEPFPRALLAGMPTGDADPHRPDDALNRLLALGLLERAGAEQLRLHRLLAAFVVTTVARLDAGDEEDGVMTTARAALEEAVISLAYRQNTAGDPRALRAWDVHLRHVAGAAGAREDNTAATLQTNLGYYLQMSGDLARARPYYERALAIDEKVYGLDYPEVATDLNNLGMLLQAQGDLAGARPYYERALAIAERVLGPDHPDTAGSLNNLGFLLRAQGDLAGARPYYERALAIAERVLDPKHPQTATAVNNLGNLLQAQGDLAGARPYYERALAIRERVLGPEHPDTALSLNNLGSLLQARGDLAEARPYVERALAIWERVLGPEHPQTASVVNNLGALLYAQGDLAEARPYFERALAISERVLGPEHPDTALSLNNLGYLLQDQGDLAGARPYFERALAISERVLGPEHPDTAISYVNFGALLAELGEKEKARGLLERAAAVFLARLGPDHQYTRIARGHLASLR